MRNYEGAVGLAETKDPILRRNLFVMDRYLRLLDAAGFASGQPVNTGAGGSTHGEGCCPNEVDEFERVNDATEGILSFGRATELSGGAALTGHTITRIEGGELNALFNLNGDTVAGAVTLSTSVVHTGTYSILITKGGAAAANFSLSFKFDADGQTKSTAEATDTVMSWRAWIRFSALPDAARQIITLRNGAAVQSQLNLSNTGALTLDGNAGSTILAINTWYELVGLYDSASTGSHSIKIRSEGGTRSQEFSNITPAASDPVNNILFGSTSVAGTYTMFVDDICLESGASTTVVDYPPEGGVYAIPLTANGAITSDDAGAPVTWGITGAATEWEACTAPHSAGSFIAVSNAGARNQSFLQTPQAAVINVNCAQFNNIVSSSTGGNYTCILKIGQTNATPVGSLTSLITGSVGGATATQILGSLEQVSNFSTDPWTHTELETMVVVAHANPTGVGQVVSVYTLVTQVDVGPAVETDFARAIRVTAAEGYVIPAFLVQDGGAFDADDDWARLVAGHDGPIAQVLLTDPSGRLITVGGGGITVDLADDAAFTIATSRVVPMGALADETATDSVDEGDIGVPRMTLDRKLLTGSELTDDAAFGVATSKVSVIGFLADETATDSVDEGDVGAARMTLDRRVHVKNTDFSTGATLGDTDANPNTTKVGACIMGLTEDTRGGTPTWTRVSTEAHASDDLGDTDDVGLHVADVHKNNVITLDNISTAYDSAAETATSQSIDCRRFRYGVLTFTLDSTGTPTDIVFDIQSSPDNSVWFNAGDGFHQDLRYDDTVCATAINEAIRFPILDRYVRVVVTSAGGTGAGTKFDVSNAKLYLGN